MAAAPAKSATCFRPKLFALALFISSFSSCFVTQKADLQLADQKSSYLLAQSAPGGNDRSLADYITISARSRRPIDDSPSDVAKRLI